MYLKFSFLIVLSILLGAEKTNSQSSRKAKSILVVLLARNKEHTLPYFLTIFENFNYPKDRLSLFIRSDHNQDKTIEILEKWLSYHQNNYHSVDVLLKKDGPQTYHQEGFPSNWTDDRFDHIINLKDEALRKARNMWADYIWFLDLDVLIIDPNLLTKLIDENKPIIAPMLNSLGTYSNYWCGMTEQYWYTRTDEYLPILERKEKGCFQVPMVHSCFLIDLTRTASNLLSFDPKNVPGYDIPLDDIITFALGSKSFEMDMFVCNYNQYGFIPPPLQDNDPLSKDYLQLIDIKLEILVENEPLSVSSILKDYAIPHPPKMKLGLDNIYLMNLARRTDRKKRMLQSFNELGIEAQIFEAIDGKRINDSYLESLGIKQLEIYKDPWSKRDMTYGEIGCFLSHYFIWEDIVNNEYEKAIIFEDDIRFQPYFVDKFNYAMNQVKQLGLPWDLIYLGRKKLQNSYEPWVDGSDIIVHADYSYWTLCYVISLQGAKKLLRPQPLNKMVPVDEYIPIMFDKHPEADWKAYYEPRDLNGYSAEPLMVYPTHYTGEEGYISDTEESPIIDLLMQENLNAAEGPPSLDVKSLGINIDVNDFKRDEL